MNVPISFVETEAKTISGFKFRPLKIKIDVGSHARNALRRVSKRRASERRLYWAARARYLEAHPFCEITLGELRITEDDVRAIPGFDGTIGRLYYNGVEIPRAVCVHHRNKCRGARLLDERWWMAAALGLHDRVEFDKHRSRREGFLLPLEADENGRSPDGTQALTTPEFLKYRAWKERQRRAAL